MVKYKIVLVLFPFDDFSTTKVRPVVCLTEPVGNFEHIVIAFITSKQPKHLLPTDILLDISQLKDFKETGLQLTSVIRIHKLTTVPKYLIKRELGKIPSKLRPSIDRALRSLFVLQ